MNEQTIAYLEQLVANEVTDKITSIILAALILLGLFGFWLYAIHSDKKTNELRKEWFANLTEEQKKAIREEKKLKL